MSKLYIYNVHPVYFWVPYIISTYTREAKREDGEFQSQSTKNYNVVSERKKDKFNFPNRDFFSSKVSVNT